MTDREYLKKYLPSDKFEDGLMKLSEGVPVQYIIGNVDFYGIELEVNSSVLIPRFETELLVQKTISYVRKYFNEPLDIIDLGTGSGAIAITLGKHLKSRIDAIDISLDALDVAKRNANKNKVDINFFQSDMLDECGKYDLIISNPPYISFDEDVQDIVRNNEPSIALYASDDGLEFYEKILKEAGSHLNKNGMIAFEIGCTQGERVKKIAMKYFSNPIISIEKDLTGRDRYVFIRVMS